MLSCLPVLIHSQIEVP